MDLLNTVIKVAFKREDLRPHLLPLIKEAARGRDVNTQEMEKALKRAGLWRPMDWKWDKNSGFDQKSVKFIHMDRLPNSEGTVEAVLEYDQLEDYYSVYVEDWDARTDFFETAEDLRSAIRALSGALKPLL